MKRGETLSDILTPWLGSLEILGPKLVPWRPARGEMFMRGESHWYTMNPDDSSRESWILTIRGDHVEVRDDKEENSSIMSWHILNAADPNFLLNLEADIRAILGHLKRN